MRIVPLHTVPRALTAGALLGYGRPWRVAAWVGTAGLALLAVARVRYHARLDVRHRAYLPALRFLQAHVRPGDVVLAGGEFGVGLGYARQVHDDGGLGYARDRAPRFIVVSTEWADRQAAEGDPARRRHVAEVKWNFARVFSAEAGRVRYDVLERRAP